MYPLVDQEVYILFCLYLFLSLRVSIEKLFRMLSKNIPFIHFVSKSLFVHDAFNAFNFVIMSRIPLPPSFTGAIRVFLFILSVSFHIKLKIYLFKFFKY